jgi:hypothetical protein
MGDFLEGHGDVLRGNRCLVGLGNSHNSIDDQIPFVGRLWGGCEDSHVTLAGNHYFTPDGVVKIACHEDDYVTLDEIQRKFGLEGNSTGGTLPSEVKILHWAKSIMDCCG